MECRVTESRFWSWLPLLAAALSTYGPVGNNYGFALYFLSWRHGFVKRGLLGELFSSIPFLSRTTLLAIELVFIAAAYLLTYILFRRLLFGEGRERIFAALLLSAPAMLPHIGYLFAQPDVMLYLIVLLSLAAWIYMPALAAIWISCALSMIAMLAHEAFLLMFYPLLLAILWRKCRRKEVRWNMALCSIACVAIAWIMIVHFGTLKVSPDLIWAEALARTNVPVQRQVYDVMASSLHDQWLLVQRMYTPGVVRVFLFTLILSVPYFWMLGEIAKTVLHADGAKRIDRVLLIALMLSPLVLCLLGHDTTRWIGAGCMSVSLYLLYLLMEDREGTIKMAIVEWMSRTNVYVWIAYLFLIGPFGATGIRSAEQINMLWRLQ